MRAVLRRVLAVDRRKVATTFGRFLIVGLISTSVHYLVLIAMVELLHWSAVLGSGCGFSLGAVVSYLMNRSFTFRSDAPHERAVVRFVAVLAVGLVLNLLLMHAFTVRLGLPYLLAQVLTTGLVLFWHFGGNALWSFARHQSRQGDQYKD
jgi:putative flippase GtrA